MIEQDYGLARIVLQIVMEERTGRRAREAKAWEDAQAVRARKELGRGTR